MWSPFLAWRSRQLTRHSYATLPRQHARDATTWSCYYWLIYLFFPRSLTQACANQLIQDAIMFRFLLFSGQTTMTWQDEIHFTEKMGDGEAFPDSKSANRKFHPKVPDERLGYFSNDPNEGLMYQGTEGWYHNSLIFKFFFQTFFKFFSISFFS